jgi:hypothetical protein
MQSHVTANSSLPFDKKMPLNFVAAGRGQGEAEV